MALHRWLRALLLKNKTEPTALTSLCKPRNDLTISAGVPRVGLKNSFISGWTLSGPLVNFITGGLLEFAY